MSIWLQKSVFMQPRTGLGKSDVSWHDAEDGAGDVLDIRKAASSAASETAEEEERRDDRLRNARFNFVPRELQESPLAVVDLLWGVDERGQAHSPGEYPAPNRVAFLRIIRSRWWSNCVQLRKRR